MYENIPVGIRISKSMLKQLAELEKEEGMDRSTATRQLLALGLKEYLKQKAVQLYRTGKVTFSRAAKIAKVSVWEFQRILIEAGVTSGYSIEDLELEK
ncbi:MAG TPA: UPF0175 family protein [Candidatus Bilamarchaeaceae archaeon]|nr:UPF0175 family protein [Candidatus Bilamarchaeaceae archaeon]